MLAEIDWRSWFHDDWSHMLRVLVIGVCAYVGLVFLLRISGKRTLSKMNAFDLVVTVALGSTLAATILNDSVALTEGLTAFATLIFIQWIVAWTCARSDAADRVVKSVPTVILWKGEILRDVMKSERVSEEEVLSAIRNAGLGSFDEVEAVVLETTGDVSVVTKKIAPADGSEHDALRGVTKYPGDDVTHPRSLAAGMTGRTPQE